MKYIGFILSLFLVNISLAQSDGCSAATPIAVTANCSSPTAGTTTGATQTIAGCLGTADDDVWYSFVATSTTHEITVDGAAGFDAVAQLFSGSCSTLISLGCQDQTLDGGVETIYATGLTIGNTYTIRVYHYFAGSGTGNFTICVTEGTPPPSNDVCTNAIGLTVNTVCSYTSGTSAGATESLTGCAGNADDDVWYSFVATNAVQTITVDPSSSMDPVLQLFEGSCAGLTSLYCEDSGFTNGNEQISAVGLIPGNTYFIRVYDYYTSTGGDAFDICITGDPTAIPSNDEPCNAIALPSVTSACNYLNFTTVGATTTTTPGAPSSCVGGSGAAIGGYTTGTADVWFSVEAPASGELFITPQPGYGISDGVMVLYSGTCGSLTQITCSDDNNYPGSSNDLLPYIAETGLTPGQTYYIRYFGFGTSSGDFGLCVQAPTNDDCVNALYICDLNGYSASTSAAYTPDRPGTGAGQMYGNNETPAGVNQVDGVNTGGPFGGTTYDVNIENNSWITFTAANTTATLYVSIYDCWVGNFPSGGIQMEIFSATNCDNFVSVSNFEESSTGFTITATGLTIGQDYYLMVDGYAGDICNYTITAESGVAFPDIISTANPICSGETTTLTAPATASSYFWTPGGATTQSIIVSPSTTTTYTCVVEGVCGYKQTLTHTVDVNQLPTLTNNATNTTCSDVALNLPITTDLTSTYSWSATNNANVTGETTTTSTAATITDDLVNNTTSAQTVIYTVTPTSSDGCIGPPQNFNVVVNPLPTMNSSSAETICSEDALSINLQSNIAATYQWSAANNTNITGESTTTQTSIIINDALTNTSTTAQTVNYTVTPTSTGGSCIGPAQAVTVTVNPKPVMTSSNSATVCSGSSPNLALTSNMGATYAWVATSNTSVTGESTTTQSSSTIADVLTNTSGAPTNVNYTVYSTGSIGGCSGDPQAVTVLVNPVPSMTSGNTDAICDGETLNFGLTSDIASSFTWVATSNTNVGGESTTNQTGATINNTLTNGTSSAEVVNYDVYPTATSGGCQGATQTVAVTVNPTPDANAGSTATIDCNNSSVSLSGSSTTAGVNFSWSGPGIVSGGSTATPTVNATGSYTLTVTDPSTTCTNTSNVTVNSDLTTPTMAATSSASVVDCNNTSVTLDGTGSSTGAGYTLLWNTSDGNITGTTNTITTTADQDGTYTLTITDNNNGCSDNIDVVLTIDTISPNANAGADQTLTCATTTLTLNGSSTTPGATFSWTGPSIVSGGSTATPDVNGTGNYILTVTDPSNGCTATDDMDVIADANIPDANIGATTDLDCNTTTTVIAGSSSTGGVNFSWATTGGNIVSGGTTATPTVDAPGSYTLTVTDPGNGCTNTANITINEDVTLPTVTATPSAAVVDCNNPVITLDGTGSTSGVGITTTWSTTDGNITGSTSALSTTADQDGTYTLTILNTNNGCSDDFDVVLTIDTASPNAVAGADVNFPCGVATVALDGSGSTGTGITYLWTGPGIITNATTAAPDVDLTGTFTLTVTGSNGCTDTDAVDVIPDSNAPVADAGTDLTVTCTQNILPVNLDGTGSDSGANITYSWSTTGTGIITNGTTTTPTVDQEGAYTILVTNTSNNCTATATVNIVMDTVTPTADLTATATTIITCNTNNQAVLDASNSTGSNLTYNYTTGAGNIVSQTGATATVDASGLYTITVTADNGCTDMEDITITMDTVSPQVSITLPDTLNCNVADVIVDATNSTGTNETYLWTTTDGVLVSGDNTNQLTAGGTGTYVLTATNDNGCSSSASVNVITAQAPLADFTPSPTSGIIPLDVTLTNNSSGLNLTYDWDLGDGTTSNVFEPSNTYDEMGTYTIELIVTDQFGCTDTASAMIDAGGEYSIIIPNIFTPNGDDNNDIFKFTLQNATDLHCIIYNRWGQFMYEFEALDGGWDGRTASGVEASEGGYYYLLWVTDFLGEVHEYQGPFELQR
jgi:gliding motility-associated-like protein